MSDWICCSRELLLLLLLLLLLSLLLAAEVEKGWTVNHRYLLGKRLLLILKVLIMQN
jgi:hypothetical protein